MLVMCNKGYPFTRALCVQNYDLSILIFLSIMFTILQFCPFPDKVSLFFFWVSAESEKSNQQTLASITFTVCPCSFVKLISFEQI